MKYREAKIEDIEGIQRVRHAVKENVLPDPALISNKDVEAFLFKRGKGWVCLDENRIVGFGIIDLTDKNVWALFIEPAYENKGIGKRLHETMLNWYFSQTKELLWLGTSPNTRAEGFYRKLGWKENGKHGADEIKFEMKYKNWMKSIKIILIIISSFLLQQGIHAQGNSDSGIIPVDQFKLHYKIEGQGKPAIVIGSSIYYPRTFSKELRKQIKFVFLDHRGFAPSPGKVDTTAFALDKILMDIERTRQQLNLGQIMIIGHSGHSFMALEYAKKYPEHVTVVVLIGIAPDLSEASAKLSVQTWQESVDPIRKAAIAENIRRFPDEKLAQLSPSEAFVQSYVRNGPYAWYDPHFDSSPFWEGVEANTDMFNYMWGRVFRDIDITKGLDNFHKPVFLALGRYDYLVAPPASWDPIRPKFHDLTIRVFEKSGHTPQYEQAALFDKELLKWLDSKKE